MNRICVFCGAATGNDPIYARAAAALGRTLAARSIELVTGGGKVGLMGVVADAALESGGRVIGVIPRGLEEREVAHRGLTELRVVETLHERKALMHELSDAFVALPGGFGTLDELAEAVTWAQLGIHEKPIGLLDVAGISATSSRMSIRPSPPGSSPPPTATSWRWTPMSRRCSTNCGNEHVDPEGRPGVRWAHLTPGRAAPSVRSRRS